MCCSSSRPKGFDISGAVVCLAAMEDLDAQIKGLNKRKAETNARNRADKRNEAKRSKRQSTHLAKILYEAGLQEQCPRLEAKLQAQLLMLLELAGCDADIVASFVLGQGRLVQYGGSGLDVHDEAVRQAISSAVCSLHLAAADNLLVDHSYVHGKDLDMQSLGRYVVEYRIFNWVLQQNCEKGLSPGPGLVREMASKQIPEELPSHIRHVMKQLFISGGRAGRYWLTSFQQRWDAKIGCLGIGIDLGPALLEQKEPWSV